MSELKPCPFCGGEAKKYAEGLNPFYKKGYLAFVKCPSCGSRGPVFHFNLKCDKPYYEEHAITAWNRRRQCE